MKKLATLMLGLSLLFGSVAVTFARQDTSKKDTSKSKNKNKNKSKDTMKDKTGK